MLVDDLICLDPRIAGKKLALYTFCCMAPMLPMAFLFSKIFKTNWKIEDNPLNDPGLRLKLAHLFYFPFVFIYFGQQPQLMVMALAIITGAHFLPYGWFYNTKSSAIMAGVLSVGATIIGTQLKGSQSLYISLFMSTSLIILSIWVFVNYKKMK